MELKIKITIVLVAKTRGDVLIECMKQSGIVVGIASNRAGHTAKQSCYKCRRLQIKQGVKPIPLRFKLDSG